MTRTERQIVHEGRFGGSRLLRRLPPADYDRLISHSQPLHYARNRVLYEPGDTMRRALFINSGMVSLLALTEDGQTIEIATVGNEGFIGVPIIHEVAIAPYRVTVQAPVNVLAVEADRLKSE